MRASPCGFGIRRLRQAGGRGGREGDVYGLSRIPGRTVKCAKGCHWLRSNGGLAQGEHFRFAVHAYHRLIPVRIKTQHPDPIPARADGDPIAALGLGVIQTNLGVLAGRAGARKFEGLRARRRAQPRPSPPGRKGSRPMPLPAPRRQAEPRPAPRLLQNLQIVRGTSFWARR